MSRAASPQPMKTRPRAYEGFIGLDTLRAFNSQDVGRNQPLQRFENGFIDSAGQITRSPGVTALAPATNVVHVRHFLRDEVAWIESHNDTLMARSTTGSKTDVQWPSNARVTSVAFARKLVFMAPALVPFFYNGGEFTPVEGALASRLRPAFGVTVGSRLAVGGMIDNPQRIEISRVNRIETFADEEKDDEESVLRGGYIDLSEQLGTQEPITGLANWESNKLVIFTADRAMVWKITPDIDEWAIEDKAQIYAGCISHATIQQAGADILFCSRSGVQSLRRSRENGVLIFSVPMSKRIERIYRKLAMRVPDPKQIEALWNSDTNQYDIFFPVDGAEVFRLTMTLDEMEPDKPATWSLTSFLSARCGSFQEGSMVLGSADGLFSVGHVDDEIDETYPDLVIETPLLYLGSYDTKAITQLLIQAEGNSTLVIEYLNEDGETVLSRRAEANELAEPDQFFDPLLAHDYRLPTPWRTQVLRLRVTASGKGLFRLSGFAFILSN